MDLVSTSSAGEHQLRVSIARCKERICLHEGLWTQTWDNLQLWREWAGPQGPVEKRAEAAEMCRAIEETLNSFTDVIDKTKREQAVLQQKLDARCGSAGARLLAVSPSGLCHSDYYGRACFQCSKPTLRMTCCNAPCAASSPGPSSARAQGVRQRSGAQRET